MLIIFRQRSYFCSEAKKKKKSCLKTRIGAVLLSDVYTVTAPFTHAAVSSAHLHNCALCSCRWAVASTCPTRDCRTLRRPSCSCRRLHRPRTASCSRRTPLSGNTEKGGQRPSRKATSQNRDDSRAAVGPASITSVASAHVHVGHLSPAVAARVINLATLPHQGSVVAAHGVQQTFQHAYACSGRGADEAQCILPLSLRQKCRNGHLRWWMTDTHTQSMLMLSNFFFS